MAAGTDSTSSSLTSTSHTLTHAPGMAPASSNHVASAMAAFLDSIEPSNSHAFLQPASSIPAGSLQLAKETLDAFAAQVSDEQQLRQREASKKRKRSGGRDQVEVLKIRKLHVDGFETGQIWQQAKRIIKSALIQSQENLQELQVRKEVELSDAASEISLDGDEIGGTSFELAEVISSADEYEEEDESDIESESLEKLEAFSNEEASLYDEVAGDAEEDSDSHDSEDSVEEFIKDPNGLNDGFFSIDQFNKQSQWLEDQDARGDPNTDLVSDDEDFDWHADPRTPSFGQKPSRPGDDDEEELGFEEHEDEMEDDDEEQGGSTPPNMDLDTMEGMSDDEGGIINGAGGLDDMDEVYHYKDFFAPPAGSRKARKKKSSLPEIPRDEGADMRRAMNDVRRDLFDDLSEHHSDSEDALSELSAGDPRSRRSAHERRQAKIAEEIRKLESELVAKRAWTMSGEAAAVDRPLNSLLEEDLDFEHAGKPVPVITEEVTESIEALIKRRILAQEFDEVLRRRPDTLGDPSSARRGLAEVDTSKSRLGLGDELAEEHVKNANPDSYVGKSDEKLQREEQEIQNMWKEICGKLDSLSSWHYKPKPVEPTLTVVSDIATISMEDAQPTTAQGVGGGESMIAPQEIYKASKETAEQGEVVSKSGLPVARQEMSREDKLRRRRREKERVRKAGGTDAKNGLSKKAQERKDTVSELKKGGVMVINRQGEIANLNGKTSGQKTVVSSSNYKL